MAMKLTASLALLMAALVGATKPHENLMSYTNTYTFLNLAPYMTMKYNLAFDATWGTGYAAGLYNSILATPATTAKFNYEKYFLTC